MKLVYQSQQIPAAEADGADDGDIGEPVGAAALSEAASSAGRGVRGPGKAKENLQQLLRQMRSSRPSLVVAGDVLNEEMLYHKAWMCLSCFAYCC